MKPANEELQETLAVERQGSIHRDTLASLKRLSIPAGSALVAALAFLLWQVASNYLFVVAAPGAAISVLVSGFTQGWIIPHAQATFGSAMVGFGLAILLGVGWGIFLGVSTFWRSVWEPLLLSAYAVPKLILFPIFLIFFGIGFQAQVAMAFIHAVFPLIILTTTGVREINPVFVKVGRSYNVGLADFLTKIYLPAIALPLVVALRMGFSLSIIGVVLAELFASRMGLGRVVMQSYSMLNIPRMYSVILLLFLVAFVGNVFLWVVEKRLRGVIK